jgi:hypothetical protein
VLSATKDTAMKEAWAKRGAASRSDKFSLMVVGKNFHEEGYSTVEITVSGREAPKEAPKQIPMTLSAVGQ